MTKELTKKNFDYSTVDKDTKSQLIWYAGEIHKAHETIGSSIVSIGESLSAAQELLAKPGSGVFVKWAESEFGLSKSTAYRLVNSYREFGDCPNLGKIEDSALYALSENSTPEKARQEAKKLAKQGNRITHKIAKEIIKKHKAKESSSDQGEPGGDGISSSDDTPVAGGPASSATAASETDPFDVESEDVAKETAPEDSCPVCAGTKWVEGKFGFECKKCSHVHGEPAGDPDEDRIKTQRSKTVKTAEALMRAFDDLDHICPNPKHGDAITSCKGLLSVAKEWK